MHKVLLMVARISDTDGIERTVPKSSAARDGPEMDEPVEPRDITMGHCSDISIFGKIEVRNFRVSGLESTTTRYRYTAIARAASKHAASLRRLKFANSFRIEFQKKFEKRLAAEKNLEIALKKETIPKSRVYTEKKMS